MFHSVPEDMGLWKVRAFSDLITGDADYEFSAVCSACEATQKIYIRVAGDWLRLRVMTGFDAVKAHAQSVREYHPGPNTCSSWKTWGIVA